MTASAKIFVSLAAAAATTGSLLAVSASPAAAAEPDGQNLRVVAAARDARGDQRSTGLGAKTRAALDITGVRTRYGVTYGSVSSPDLSFLVGHRTSRTVRDDQRYRVELTWGGGRHRAHSATLTYRPRAKRMSLTGDTRCRGTWYNGSGIAARTVVLDVAHVCVGNAAVYRVRVSSSVPGKHHHGSDRTGWFRTRSFSVAELRSWSGRDAAKDVISPKGRPVKPGAKGSSVDIGAVTLTDRSTALTVKIAVARVSSRPTDPAQWFALRPQVPYQDSTPLLDGWVDRSGSGRFTLSGRIVDGSSDLEGALCTATASTTASTVTVTIPRTSECGLRLPGQYGMSIAALESATESSAPWPDADGSDEFQTDPVWAR